MKNTDFLINFYNFLPPLTLFTLLLVTKKIRISLEFDVSGTGFEAFSAAFCLYNRVHKLWDKCKFVVISPLPLKSML